MTSQDLGDLATARTEKVGDLIHAVLAGELDISNARSLQIWLRRASDGTGGLVLDLSELTFLDGSSLAALRAVHQHLLRAGRMFQVTTLPNSVAARTLHLSGMDQVLPIAYVSDEPVHVTFATERSARGDS
jgi:anti-anti-sigma factor